MRIFTFYNNSFYLEKDKKKLTLNKALYSRLCLSSIPNWHFTPLRSKSYSYNKDCNVNSIIRDAENDKSTIRVDAESKKPLQFDIMLKKNRMGLDDLRITGLYDAKEPADIKILAQRKGKRIFFHFPEKKIKILKNIAKDIKTYSRMTQKLLKKSMETFKK